MERIGVILNQIGFQEFLREETKEARARDRIRILRRRISEIREGLAHLERSMSNGLPMAARIEAAKHRLAMAEAELWRAQQRALFGG
jgi:hypothetical protein